jgi:serine/threonine protein kinase
MLDEILDLFDVGPRYIVEKCIGRGTYGYVAQALDTHTDTKVSLTQVAIKKLNKLDCTTDIKRYIREIRTLRVLKHDNVLFLKNIIHKK